MDQEHRRAVTALGLWLALALAAAPARASEAAPAPSDPIEGKWAGQAGLPQDRVEIAFEFRRDPAGALRAYLYQPVMNFYGLDLSSVVPGSADRYELPEVRGRLQREGDRLTGIYFSVGLPIELRRTERLPAEEPVPALPAGPGPRWRARLGGAIYAPVAVRDGVAYVGTTSGVFNAVKVEDGSILWAVPVGRPVFGEALATAEAVYLTSDDGYLRKLSRADGKELWRYDLGGERVPRVLMHQKVFEWDYRAPRPVLADGLLLVGSADGSFHAVRAADGVRAWRHSGAGRVRADALVDGPRVVFGDFNGLVVALDRATGKELWRRETRAPVNASPALVGERLVVANRGGLLSALDPATGAVLWRSVLWGSAAESTPVAHGDRFYVGASDLRRVTCYDPTDGRVVWRTDVYGISWGRPAVTEKAVYASAGGFEPYQMRHLGGLSALDRATGRTLWRWEAPRSPDHYESGFAAGPVLAGGLVLVGSMNGVLYAFPAS